MAQAPTVLAGQLATEAGSWLRLMRCLAGPQLRLLYMQLFRALTAYLTVARPRAPRPTCLPSSFGALPARRLPLGLIPAGSKPDPQARL